MKWLYRILRLLFTPGCRHVWKKDLPLLDKKTERDICRGLMLVCKKCGEHKNHYV